MSSPNAKQAVFTDVSMNRNELTPIAGRAPDQACFHKGVTTAGAAGSFSKERNHPVYPVKLPGLSVSMSIGTLSPGQATTRHRHAYESLIYVIEGAGYTEVDGVRFDWEAGDAVYVPPWCWHVHTSAPDVSSSYLTSTNMPLLTALQQTVMRQEGSDND